MEINRKKMNEFKFHYLFGNIFAVSRTVQKATNKASTHRAATRPKISRKIRRPFLLKLF